MKKSELDRATPRRKISQTLEEFEEQDAVAETLGYPTWSHWARKVLTDAVSKAKKAKR